MTERSNETKSMWMEDLTREVTRSNEEQAFLWHQGRAQGKSSQLGEKCITVFNAQSPLDGPAFIFDCDDLRHREI